MEGFMSAAAAKATNVLDESRLTITDAAKLFPGRSGETVTRQTVHRWGKLGTLVNGRRVKLEMRRVGAAWWTSREAVQRFVDATNPAGA
jgi:hypothetical protein